jgi:hypothetical protein
MIALQMRYSVLSSQVNVVHRGLGIFAPQSFARLAAVVHDQSMSSGTKPVGDLLHPQVWIRNKEPSQTLAGHCFRRAVRAHLPWMVVGGGAQGLLTPRLRRLGFRCPARPGFRSIGNQWPALDSDRNAGGPSVWTGSSPSVLSTVAR